MVIVATNERARIRLGSSADRQGIVFHYAFSITIRRVERSSPPLPSEPTDLALRDDLTGAWNRRYLRQLLDEDWAALVAAHGTVTLLVLDLDFFKEVNDAHGHLAGDRVLQQAAQQLRASFRGEDRLIRYGGDEFVVALFGAGAEEARALAERARSVLATVGITAAEGGPAIALPLSFSMGAATFPVDGASGEEILAVADRRLYEEKRARRPPTSVADRGRSRLLLASGLALVVLALAGWIEWRRLHKAPPPPPTAETRLATPAEEPSSLAEIVVRDEGELVRLREEVKRLQAELAEARPADDRRRYLERIRELETRLTEAGDESGLAAGSADLPAQVAGTDDTAGATAGVGGLQIGERRLREGLELPPPAGGAGEGPPSGDAAFGSHRPATGAPGATGATGAMGAAGASGAEPRIEPPQLVRAIRPDYPPVARARRRMATVELKVRVDAAGKVIAAEPVGPPAGLGFDESARAAALSAQFRPGRRDGVAVEMETRLAIRFLLEGPPR